MARPCNPNKVETRNHTIRLPLEASREIDQLAGAVAQSLTSITLALVLEALEARRNSGADPITLINQLKANR